MIGALPKLMTPHSQSCSERKLIDGLQPVQTVQKLEDKRSVSVSKYKMAAGVRDRGFNHCWEGEACSQCKLIDEKMPEIAF